MTSSQLLSKKDEVGYVDLLVFSPQGTILHHQPNDLVTVLTSAAGFPKLRSWYPALYTGPLWGASSLWGVRGKILAFSLAFFFLNMFFSKESAWLESHVWEKTTSSIVRRDMVPFRIYMKWAFIQ